MQRLRGTSSFSFIILNRTPFNFFYFLIKASTSLRNLLEKLIYQKILRFRTENFIQITTGISR